MDSARAYPIMESPGRHESIPNVEIAKGLMRNRQLGNPMTPSGKQSPNIKEGFEKLLYRQKNKHMKKP